MIRINLLEETRTKAKKRGGGGLAMPSFDVAENVGVVIMLGGIALAAGVILTWFMLNKAALSELDSKIAKAEAEKKRLEYVLKRNEELKAKKKELTHRIEIIRELKANQDRPVRMMDEVSKELSASDNVWFQDLTFSGDQLTVTGQALSKFNYSKFLANLEKSDCFDEVHMGITEEKDTPDGTLVSFRMDAVFIPDCGAAARAAAAASSSQSSAGARTAGGAGTRGRR